MDEASPFSTIRKHITQFFAGHEVEEHVWTLGPAAKEFPELRVLQVAPGPRSNLWVYATVGAYTAQTDSWLEFMITAPARHQRHVELLFMTVWYHGHRHLGLGHTFPLGGPWLPQSNCDHFLVSKPYPFGPDLEICPLIERHTHILWLLPITRAERELKVREGLEALEQRFDDAALEYWSIRRASVI